MNVHFIVHEDFEAPGAYDIWVKMRGYSASYSRVYDGDVLPSDATGIDLLVVLGGPQDPITTQEECPHFDAAGEIVLINAAIKAGCAVVGVCLGSQLIGEALGASYDHSPDKEIGSFPITLTDEGRKHPKLEHFTPSAVVGHWHNDMPGLTSDAKILAYSAGCPRQIVEYTPLVYGFQCHLEFTSESIELIVAHSEDELDNLTHEKYVQTPDALRRNNYSNMNNLLFVFLDKLVEEYQALYDETRKSSLG